MDQLRASEKGTADAARDLGAATKAAGDAQARAAGQARQAAQASDGVTRNLGLQRAGWQSVGFQMQDVFASYASGTRATVIFAQQSGQLVSALAMVAQSSEGSKGKFAAFAGFMGGPWGIAIGVAVSLIGALSSSLLKSGDDAETAAGKVDRFTRSLNNLAAAQGKVTAIDLGNAEVRLRQLQGRRNVLSEEISGSTGTRATQQRRIALEAERDKVDSQIVDATGLVEAGRMRLRNQQRLDRDKPQKDNSAAKAAKETERLAVFGERAEDAIARLNDQFNIAPRDIDKARQATGQLDDIIRDINKKLTEGKGLTAEQRKQFEALKVSAAAVKPLIQDSLVRPIRDMLDDQQRQIDLGKLQLQGRQAEAQALQLTWSLMDKMGVESEAQLATELAKRGVTGDQVRQLYDNLGVMRQQTREMQRQQAVQDAYLHGLGDMRENIRLTLADLRRDGPKAVGDFFKRSMDVADNLFADIVTEKLFGGLFRDLQDQVTGANKVSKAGDKIASAVDDAASHVEKFGDAVAQAVTAITGKAGVGTAAPAGSLATGLSDGIGAMDANAIIAKLGKFDPVSDSPANGGISGTLGNADGPDIVVTGRKKGAFQTGFEGMIDELKGGLKKVFTDIFGEKGLFDASLGKTLGRAFAGAQIGSAVGKGVTDAIGVKGSSTGGAIGGAIGSMIPQLGPFGPLLGGIAGSLVGGLFKTTKTGAANITSVDGAATVSGNSSGFKANASGAASSIQDGLSAIAEQLGGSVGGFNVTIGQRHGDWRVRTGAGSLKVAKGAKEFDDDQAGAIAYGMQLAITQGAVTGLSDALQQAIRSNSDINKALAEALKVQEVETLLGGVGAELQQQMKAFETQAKERLRIATTYGFDIVEIEKRNAEDRAKLLDDILASRVGSLQQLLDDVKYGDLFEGSTADQRAALTTEIAKARADAEAGVDGAADTLAELLRRRLDVTLQGYGTAGGEYAADRADAVSAAESVIAAENARIKSAQDAVTATNTKLDTANQIANEQTNLLVEMNAKLAALLGSGVDLSAIAQLDLSLVGRSA